MHFIDWLIITTYLIWIVSDGLKRSKGLNAIRGYFLANRSLPWWAVGLTVMATQMSAITLVGTTGQGYTDGMRFVQFYFGLPVAMIILSVTLVPFFYRANVYTAYEYLERRFDVRTRTLASLLFLLSRGLQAGVVIAAPAVILSIILNLNLTITILAIGLPTTIYTMFGGVQAVTWTDVKQMVIIVAGLAAAIVGLVMGLPDEIGVGEALHVAGTTGRLLTLDFTFDLNETYTVWSGMIGGLFLMLGYFGCDQSQVQRYLTARSVTAARQSLMMSAFAKIPLQALILLTGVLVFTFYLFNAPPMLFNTVHDQQMRSSPRMAEYEELNSNFLQAFNDRREAARAAAAARRMPDATGIEAADALFQKRDLELGHIRDDAKALVIEVTGDRSYSDVNYVFPTFVTTQLPIGVVGLIIAAILAAAMSSIAAELNSLSTATVIDFYRRHFRREASDEHYMRISKMTTGFWGLTASIIAMYAVNLGTLIEVVNRFGSFFYGSLLGVFMLAILVRWATARGAFWGLIGGMTSVTAVALTSEVSFLWLNVVGAIAVFLVGITISAFKPSKEPVSI